MALRWPSLILVAGVVIVSLVGTAPGVGVANGAAHASGGSPSIAVGAAPADVWRCTPEILSPDRLGTPQRRGGPARPNDTLSATVSTIGGQIAFPDGRIDVRGTAPGVTNGSVVIAVIDTDSRVVAQSVPIEPDGSFEAQVPVRDESGRLFAGEATVVVISPDGDDRFGHPAKRPWSAEHVIDCVTVMEREMLLPRQQMLDRLLLLTYTHERSDDQIATREIELTSARIDVNAVSSTSTERGSLRVNTGEIATVRGTTNRNPRVATISIAAIGGPEADRFPTATAGSWGATGVWEAELRIPRDLEPGTYTLRATDGRVADTITITVVSGSTPTPGPTPEPTPTPTPEPTPTSTPTPEPTPTEGSQPGFGILVAVLAVLAAGTMRR